MQCLLWPNMESKIRLLHIHVIWNALKYKITYDKMNQLKMDQTWLPDSTNLILQNSSRMKGETYFWSSYYSCACDWIPEKRTSTLPHVSDIKKWKQNETWDDIDIIVSAEFPNENDDPVLFELVKKFMAHVPCGTNNPSSPCLDKGFMSKEVPPKNSGKKHDLIWTAIQSTEDVTLELQSN